MSQLPVNGKNSPWVRNAGAASSVTPSAQMTTSFINPQRGLPGTVAISANQSYAQAAAVVVAAHQQQQQAAGLAAIRLTQAPLQTAAVLSQQPAVAINNTLATNQVGNPSGIVLPTTLASSNVAAISYPAPRVIQPAQFQHPPPTAQQQAIQQQQHATAVAVQVAQVAQLQQQQLQQQQQQQQQHQQQQQAVAAATTMNKQQRAFTGTITKLHDNFGFVDEDVFFQLSCVKGVLPKVGDRVLVEANYSANMPFKWNATRIQVLTNLNQNQNNMPPAVAPPNITPSMQYAPVQPPAPRVKDDRQYGISSSSSSNLRQYEVQSNAPNVSQSNVSRVGQNLRRGSSPPRMGLISRADTSRRDDRGRNSYRDHDRDVRRPSPPRKRSRSPRNRSRSPPRRRARIVPRYSVQVPKISFDLKEGNVMELKKRYPNMYIPSDFFNSAFSWMEAFPSVRPFDIIHPSSFHVMNRDVDPIVENNSVLEPPDADYLFSAKVMLLATPSEKEFLQKTCGLDDESIDSRDNYVHPTRLLNFLVGLRGKNETMAIGGPWSPSLDGENPEKDPQVLIKTAIRNCQALTGIDLSACTRWYRFAEIYYRRNETTYKGRAVPARVETVVIYLPDVWSCSPTKYDWDSLAINYKKQLYRKQAAKNLDDQDESHISGTRLGATHYSELDPKTMKVNELRKELEARNLSSKGLKSQLIARLLKAVKTEGAKEDKIAEEFEAAITDNKDASNPSEAVDKVSKENEEDEKKSKEEKEKVARWYQLPENPAIIVHPNKTAKNGKFDCSVMSLSVLLDYRQEDNKEHSFEVSLFAELFNEMLMRDFGFAIYKCLLQAPDCVDDDKKKSEKKDDKDKKKDEDKRKDSESGKKESGAAASDMEEDEDDENDIETQVNDEKTSSKKKDVKCIVKKEKAQMFTVKPLLLLAFVYFDLNHCNYLFDKDVEEIILTLGLKLSRAQIRKLVQKVIKRDTLNYRKLTDCPKDDTEASGNAKKNEESDALCLTDGNVKLLPIFDRSGNDSEDSNKEGSESKDVAIFEGSVVQVSQLLHQLERTSKSRMFTELKLKDVQSELDEMKEVAHSTEEKRDRLSNELLETQEKLKCSQADVEKSKLCCNKYKQALHKLKDQLKSCQDKLILVLDPSDDQLTDNVNGDI